MPSLPSDAQPEPHLFGRPVLARPQTLPKAAKLAKLAKPQHAAAHRPWLGCLAVAPLPSQHNPFPWPQGLKQRNRLMMTTDLQALSLGEPRRGCPPAFAFDLGASCDAHPGRRECERGGQGPEQDAPVPGPKHGGRAKRSSTQPA